MAAKRPSRTSQAGPAPGRGRCLRVTARAWRGPQGHLAQDSRADSNLPLCVHVPSSSEELSPELTGVSAWDLNHNRGLAPLSNHFKAALAGAAEGLFRASSRKLWTTGRQWKLSLVPTGSSALSHVPLRSCPEPP